MYFHWFKDLYRSIIDRPLKTETILFGCYRIEKILGMGSYGITYAAEHCMTGEKAAIKQLRKTKSWTKAGRASFDHEVAMLRTLQHPSIPKIHEVFLNEHGRFIVMDYICGKTFEDLIFDEGIVFSQTDALQILDDVLAIVETFHKKGIIHCDLRIPNIISVEGSLYILDFGLSCFLSDEAEKKRTDAVTNMMREVSIKSDLFALGHFTLFLLYSGYHPKTKKERSWEEELSLSPEVHRILRKLLQLDEAYRSAAEVRADIQKLTIVQHVTNHEKKA